MTITQRDKRVLIGGVIAAGLILTWRLTSSSSSAPGETVKATQSIPLGEKRLAKLRQMTAAVPGKEQALKQVSTELASREKGLILADSAAQAQAQVVQVLRRIGKAQSPPLEFRGVEIGPVRPFGDSYGEVLISVSLDAQIDQLVNLLADISAQKELIATNEIRIGQAHPKQKVIPVRLTVSGIVKKSLLPVKKGPGTL